MAFYKGIFLYVILINQYADHDENCSRNKFHGCKNISKPNISNRSSSYTLRNKVVVKLQYYKLEHKQNFAIITISINQFKLY